MSSILINKHSNNNRYNNVMGDASGPGYTGLSDFISFLKAIRIFASSICLRSGTGLSGYITLRLSTSIMNLSAQHKPLLSLSRCAIYDPRFWIYDNTIMSSILRGFTAYIFIKLEITN